MDLTEVVAELDLLDDDSAICMKQPWSAYAPCRVLSLDVSYAELNRNKEEFYEFFSEVADLRARILQMPDDWTLEQKAAELVNQLWE
jgi:hypothetical protein